MPCHLSAEIKATFGPSPKLRETISQEIGNAAWTVDIAIYSLDDKTVIDSISKAAKDGVRVRLILHEPDKHQKLADKLEKAGVDVRGVNLTMHHKFAILDSTRLLTGSGSWTKTAFSRYDEDLLYFNNESAYLSSFRQEFESMWSISKEFGKDVFTPSKLKRSVPAFGRVLFTSANMTIKEHKGNTIYSPGSELPGVCGAELISAINKAEESIKIATTHFRREDIAEALKNAFGRGVKIQLLLDQQEYHPASIDMKDVFYDEELAKLGVSVRYKCCTTKWSYPTALQMHCKYMIVDDRTVLTGSLNWSRNSELNTLENLMILNRPVVTLAYVDRFKMKWNYGAGKFSEVLKASKTERSEPFYFPPISLSGDNVSDLVK